MSVFTLKSTENILIESISLNDANLRHDFFLKLTKAQKGVVHTLDEIEQNSHESYDHISDFLRNRRGLWLKAQNEQGEIIGEVDITIKNLLRINHNGNLTIGILPEYQNQGLGFALMNAAILWAKNVQLKRLELSVFKNNFSAIKLYEKCGFIVEGVRKNFLHIETEIFIDDVLMAKYL